MGRKLDPTGTNPSSSVTMLQCANARTGKTYTKMRITDPALQAELAKLKHAKSLQAVQSAILAEKRDVAFLQEHARRLRVQDDTSSQLTQRGSADGVRNSLNLDASVKRKGPPRRRRAPPRRR